MVSSDLRDQLRQYGMPPAYVYLAPILPIIRVMWADGANQLTEQALIKDYLRDHCCQLSHIAGGLTVVDPADLARFVDDFITSPPDMDVLYSLTESALTSVARGIEPDGASAVSLHEPDRLLNACMELAAACTVESSENSQGAGANLPKKRIAHQEQVLIEQLIPFLTCSGAESKLSLRSYSGQ